ncbi:gamma-glutamyltransferase family protein [Imhoffiella purpurea]|uniref:Gamma-glutamyltranspeptidase n=1 Tax=Imhoffiella purpurea TaxID=1249627 RepID=W9VCN3_9GAMM|nr:gamma-glutamyltransferase [Imhoffiella purpurea]EXJ14751.1 Gamma-glutamyltranspeptidase [Imhoffiella purpurea]
MSARQTRSPLYEDLLDPGDRRVVYPQRVGVAAKGMVSTQHYLATEAGVAMLASGGNAVDAAVAAAFALGVVEPAASGLGGQTMMLLSLDEAGRKFCLDGATRAPHRTPPGELERAEQLRGHRATTVPSTPAVLAYALKHYGTKSLAEALEPAIGLAERGYRVSPLQHHLTRRELKHLRLFSGGHFFLKAGKTPYPIGARFQQPVLAATLRRLAEAGVEDFYRGEIAAKIHADMVHNDGLIRDDDLAQIPWPTERRPLATHFGPSRVFTFGPPGAGRTLIEAINLLSQFPEAQRDPDSPRGALLLAHVIRKANLDRADRPEDPALFAQELELGEDITHLEYAKRVAKRIRTRIRSSGETTHLSVMDAAGNAVGLTQSIERVYGSFAASPELGFLYNNYMSAFEYQDITHPYYLRPNAVPWASVAPTIVFRGPQPWMTVGSPGSERIVSAILQVLLRLERGATPFDAVEAPRLHCSVKGKVSLEGTRMRDDIPRLLRRHGFEVEMRDPYSFYLGCVQLVLREDGGFVGVADPRRDGSAAGPPD